MCIRTVALNSFFLPESFWGSSHGYPVETDFICPQAFGRNTYSDKKVGAAIHSIIDANEDTITRFMRLKEHGFDPGQPNRILAKRCVKLATFIRPFSNEIGTVKEHTVIRPVIGQWEVLYSMWLYEPDWYVEHQNILFPIWPPLAVYLSTRGMMFTVREIAEAHNWYNPLIVAHPEHIQRCFFVARKIFRGSIAFDHDWNTSKEWFDRHSVQFWTRTKTAWLIYEMLARIHHRLHGWM